MRVFSRWIPAFLGLVVMAAPAWALPKPNLPPEATDKPSVVVRVRPVGELLKDVGYLAKLVGQEEIFNAFEPGLAPVLEAIDGKRPIGFYARIRAAGVDSIGVLLLPVKSEKDFLGVLAQLGVNPTAGADDLYTVNVPGSPFQVIFRFANGYAYATVKNTPEAEAALGKNKVFRPESLFTAGDESVVSVTANLDAIPNELKTKALNGLEDVLRKVKENDLPKEQNPILRRFGETVAEEVAIKIQSLIVDAQTATWRFDLDRKKEDMALSFRLTARKGSDLATDIASVGTSQGLGAGLAKDPSAVQGSVSVATPPSIKKAFEPLVDEFLNQAWRSAPANKQEQAKELLEALAPTLKAGLLDAGFDMQGPGKSGHVSFLLGVHVKEGERVEKSIRKIYAGLGDNEKAVLILDMDKADGVGIHRAPAKLDAKGQALFGADASFLFAIRNDLLVLGVGPTAEALAALKDGLKATPKASKAMQSEASVRRLARIAEAKEERIAEAAKKAFPEGISDLIRFEVAGGDAVEARFSASSRLIQFFVLVEHLRRNR